MPSPLRSIVLTLSCLTLMTATLLGGVWIGISRTACEKIVTALAMPCGLLWYALTVVVVLAYRSRNRAVVVAAILTWVLYTTGGNSTLATYLSRQIEEPFSHISPLQEDPFDTVVLLGGGAATGMNGRHQGNGAGDRLILVAQLYHAGLTPSIICTGARIAEMTNQEFDPATRSIGVLTALGVPKESIEPHGGRTTSEEMLSLGRRFADSDTRIGLVTSAWHLRRATRLAERCGLNVVPLPADFLHSPLTGGRLPLAARLESLIPSADAFSTTTRISKEYLGAFVGR